MLGFIPLGRSWAGVPGHFAEEAVEEYLEALWTLTRERGRVKTTQLARYFKVSPSSVTEMVQRLSDRGLVEYRKYHGITLTPAGTLMATKMKRRHRLLERFLADVFRLPHEQIHEYACKLEHVVDGDLEAQVCRFLGHPTADDQGNPIPPCTPGVDPCYQDDVGGELFTLAELAPGQTAMIRLVLDAPGRRRAMASTGLEPGKIVKGASGAKGSVQVEGADGTITLDRALARRVLLERGAG